MLFLLSLFLWLIDQRLGNGFLWLSSEHACYKPQKSPQYRALDCLVDGTVATAEIIKWTG